MVSFGKGVFQGRTRLRKLTKKAFSGFKPVNYKLKVDYLALSFPRKKKKRGGGGG